MTSQHDEPMDLQTQVEGGRPYAPKPRMIRRPEVTATLHDALTTLIFEYEAKKYWGVPIMELRKLLWSYEENS